MLNKFNFSIQNFINLDKEDYKRRTKDAHIFHSLEWMKIIKQTFNINHKVAILRENGHIVASMPFIKYRNLIKGHCALPLHFSGYYNSIVANNDTSKSKLLSLFFDYCENFKLYTQVPEVNKIKDFKNFTGYSFYKMQLKNDSPAEEQFLFNANKRIRNYTKNALKSNLVSYTGGLKFLEKFYTLYLQNMKEVGTPPLPKIYFKNIMEYFPNIAKIILVKNDKQVCSGMLILKVSKSELFSPFICTPRFYKVGHSSQFIYLQAAINAQNLGCSIINFGRSIDGSGPALFKHRLGLKAIPMLMYSPYKNWMVTDPNKTTLRYAVAIWKKLPIALSKLGGMLLAKHVI